MTVGEPGLPGRVVDEDELDRSHRRGGIDRGVGVCRAGAEQDGQGDDCDQDRDEDADGDRRAVSVTGDDARRP